MYNNSRRFNGNGRQRSMTPNISNAFATVVKSVKNLTSPAIIKAKKDDDYFYYNRKNYGGNTGGFLSGMDGISSYFGQKSIVSKIKRNPLYLALIGLFSLVVTIFIIFHFVQPSSSHTLVNSDTSQTTMVEEKVERQYTSFSINNYVVGPLKGKIDAVLSLYDEKLISQFDSSVESLVEDYCVSDLPFKLSVSSKLNLHAHISEIFYYIHQHGRIDEIDSSTTVVGSDGSIYDTQHTHHESKEHGYCRLVPELIEASKIINKDSMIHDKEDQFASNYNDYKSTHNDITGTNIYKDASTIIKLAMSSDENNIYKYEMDMYWALDSYCNNIYKELSYNNQYKVATNVINSVKELYNSKGRQYVNHNELKMVINKENAEINYYNVNEFHKYSSDVLTCPLLDVIMEYQVGKTSDRIERMLNEYKNHQMITYEEHLEHLLNDECNNLNNKLDKNSYNTFKNHLQSFISNIISKEPMGNNDYIVTNDGFIMHRLHANELNLNTYEYNECSLLEKLANYNENNNPIIDEEIYSRDSEILKNEKEDIKKHKYNLNARHDVYTLLQHLKMGQRYEFSSLLDDLVKIYDENIINKFNDKEKLFNHLVASYEEAFYAILDNKCPDAITKDELLAININDGYIYTQKPEAIKDPMYKSVLLEEVYNNLIAIKTQKINDEEYKIDNIDLSNNKKDIKGPLKLSDVKELIKLANEKDVIALNDLLEYQISTYVIHDLEKIYNKFHKDTNDYNLHDIKENFIDHIITLIELMNNHQGLPKNTVLAIAAKGHIVAVTEDDLKNEYKYIASEYLNELVWFAMELNNDKNNNNKINEHLLETESIHSNERSSHTTNDNKYFSDLLIMDLLDNDEFSFNDDLKYALDINCKNDQIYNSMVSTDKRTLRIQTLHYLNKILKEKSKLNQFNLKDIGFTSAGIIVNTQEYSTSATSKCLINHVINKAVQKIS